MNAPAPMTAIASARIRCIFLAVIVVLQKEVNGSVDQVSRQFQNPVHASQVVKVASQCQPQHCACLFAEVQQFCPSPASAVLGLSRIMPPTAMVTADTNVLMRRCIGFSCWNVGQGEYAHYSRSRLARQGPNRDSVVVQFLHASLLCSQGAVDGAWVSPPA